MLNLSAAKKPDASAIGGMFGAAKKPDATTPAQGGLFG